MNPGLKQLFLTAFILFSYTLFGQNPAPRITTLKEFGLDNSDPLFAMDIEVDSTGYVFITGSSGVYRFNGKKFEVYRNYSNPTKKQVGINLWKGQKNRLWVTGKGCIYLIRNDSLISFPVPEEIQQIRNNVFENFMEDEDGDLYCAIRSKGYFKINTKGEVISHVFDSSAVHGYRIEELNGNWFYSSHFDRNSDSLDIYIRDRNENLRLLYTSGYRSYKYQSDLVWDSKGSLYFSFGRNEVIHIKNGKFQQVYRTEFDVYKLFIDSRDNLWIGTVGDGVYLVKNTETFEYERIQTGTMAASAEDLNGGIWFKSESDYIGYTEKFISANYSDQSGYPELQHVRSMIQAGDSLIVQTASGEMYSLRNDSLRHLQFLKADKKFLGKDQNSDPSVFFWNDNQNEIWFGYDSLIQIWDGEKLRKLNMENFYPCNTQIRSFQLLSDGTVIGSTKLNLFKVKDNQVRVISNCTFENIQAVVPTNSGKILVETSRDLLLLKGDSLVYHKYNEFMRNNVMSYAFKHEKKLFCQFQTRGLFAISNNKLIQIKDQNNDWVEIGYHGIDTEGNLWGYAHNRGGIYKIDTTLRATLYDCDYKIQSGSNGRYKIAAVVNNDLFITSNVGLFKYTIPDLKEKTRKIYTRIKKTFVNYEPVALSNNYILNYEENNITFSFALINFQTLPLETNYRLVGQDSIWRIPSTDQIQYTNLDPGEYRFEVKSRVKNGSWGETTTVSFIITKPYWQTAWFRISLVLLILGLILLIFKLRVRYVRKKEREKAAIALELSQLELKALKSQINPHFIFNSITSAMDYLSENENEKAETYLQRFSKLTRRILENSEENSVLLADEIELMKQYVILESERFDGRPIEFKTDFSTIDPKLLNIAPSLLQPYIENAIRHGLKNKSGERLIKLNFKLNKDNLKVIIEDNGIGRVAAAEIDTRTNHKSLGMLISSRRIEILNKNKLQHVEIEDLYNQNQPTGTRVKLFIPAETI